MELCEGHRDAISGLVINWNKVELHAVELQQIALRVVVWQLRLP